VYGVPRTNSGEFSNNASISGASRINDITRSGRFDDQSFPTFRQQGPMIRCRKSHGIERQMNRALEKVSSSVNGEVMTTNSVWPHIANTRSTGKYQ
jgi:hypothetical protein